MDTLIASSTCSIVDATTTICQYFGVSTSSPPSISNVVSAGDVLVSFWLFLILTVIIMYLVVKSL